MQHRSVRIVLAAIVLGISLAWGYGSSPRAAEAATTVTVLPGQGVVFEQVDFVFSQLAVEDSDWGRATADADDLFSATGMSKGYLNIFTDAGWVVDNLIVDVGGLNPITTYFTLGLPAPGDVSVLSAHVELSSDPEPAFSDGPRSDFPVGVGEWNAEGAGEEPVTAIGPPPPPAVPGGPPPEPDSEHSQSDKENVQAAKNQCVPMSVANSLQFLENSTGLKVPHDHKKGLKGDNSLVGQLGEKMKRVVTDRKHGKGVWFVPMLEGKFEYLAAKGVDLKDKLVHKHQGRGYGQKLPDGDFKHAGITSKDEGAKVTWEFICNELKKGQDVELIYQHPKGGHAVRVVGCGVTDGKRWIRYAHDRCQSIDTPTPKCPKGGLETAEAKPVKDLDGDGILNLGSPGREIVFVLSESPASVGGIVELFGQADSPTAESTSASTRDYTAPIAAAVTAAVVALTASAWCARRRWLG